MASWLSRLFGGPTSPTKESRASTAADGDRRVLASLTWHDCSASSNVKEIAYHDGRVKGDGQQILAVRFKAKGRWSESTYFYYDCPLSVYTNMLAASSRGSFVHTSLTGQYSYRRVA